MSSAHYFFFLSTLIHTVITGLNRKASVAGLLPRSPSFDPRPVRLESVMEKFAVQQVSSGYFVYSPFNIIPSIPHTHIQFIYHQRNCIYVVILASGAVVK